MRSTWRAYGFGLVFWTVAACWALAWCMWAAACHVDNGGLDDLPDAGWRDGSVH